jgi:ankyrin repeat protein
MCAARNNRLDVVNFLLETLEELQVDVEDAEQQTALFHAAHGGHHNVVKRLIEAGARIDTRNKVTQKQKFNAKTLESYDIIIIIAPHLDVIGDMCPFLGE